MKSTLSLKPRTVDDFAGRQVYFSGRMSPFHRVHYMQIYWATKVSKGINSTVFLVEEPEPLNQTCPFTFKQRKKMILNCFPEAKVYEIKPITSFKNALETAETIDRYVGPDAVYIGGEFQHKFAAKYGGYDVAAFHRGMLDEELPPYAKTGFHDKGYDIITYKHKDYEFDFSRWLFREFEVSGSNARKLILEYIQDPKKDFWKILIPPQNHKLIENIIQTRTFKKAVERPVPKGSIVKRSMRKLGWVH